MGNRGPERRFLCDAFFVHMDPLVVPGGIRKGGDL